MTLSKSNHSSKQGDLNSQRKSTLTESLLYEDYEMNPTNDRKNQQSADSEVEQIPLFEEKLLVTRHQQKVGEVIVRKQVETLMIQLPIRREKLIVERIGKNSELLTEVVLKEDQVNGFNYEELGNNDSLHITKSQYLELQTARELLEAIAHLTTACNAKVRLEIVTNCLEYQVEHQNICDRYQQQQSKGSE